jgi:hypothetical protein
MRTMPGLSSRGVARLGSSCPPLAGFAGGVHSVQPGPLGGNTRSRPAPRWSMTW